MTPDRFTDKGETIYDFSGEILVRCPKCDGPATVRGSGRLNTEDVRLGCMRCGHTEICRGDETRRGRQTGAASDPHFGLALWLTTAVRGRELWAYNAGHLAFLKQYVAANLRERKPGINQSVASRLPRWLKDAKMREAVLKGIKALEETLPG